VIQVRSRATGGRSSARKENLGAHFGVRPRLRFAERAAYGVHAYGLQLPGRFDVGDRRRNDPAANPNPNPFAPGCVSGSTCHDWRLAAERAADSILGEAAAHGWGDPLIFVEGISQYPTSSGTQANGPYDFYWWGGAASGRKRQRQQLRGAGGAECRRERIELGCRGEQPSRVFAAPLRPELVSAAVVQQLDVLWKRMLVIESRGSLGSALGIY